MPTSELSLPNNVGVNLQFVQDETAQQTAIALSNRAVQIAPAGTAPASNAGKAVLVIQPPTDTLQGPGVVIQSASNEASIRFQATGAGAFHVGIGGGAGDGTLFFFTEAAGIVVTVGATGDVVMNRNLRVAQNLTVQGTLNTPAIGANALRLTNMRFAGDFTGGPLKHVMIDPATGALFFQ
jgi:hypothetical protein